MKKPKCPACDRDVSALQDFCPHCGQKLEFTDKEKRRERLFGKGIKLILVEMVLHMAFLFGLPALVALFFLAKNGHSVSFGTAYGICFFACLVLESLFGLGALF
jgi:predicted nucleic acid-binding Zn ribbon protein